MKIKIAVALQLLISLLVTCSAHAYIYFVEAEHFKADESVLKSDMSAWEVKDDLEGAFGDKYLHCYRANDPADSTILIYPLDPIDYKSAEWKIWFRCQMPTGGTNSYFCYISDDGGKTWSNQQALMGPGKPNFFEEWRWFSWTLSDPLKKNAGNVLKLTEREYAILDVICIRDDGQTPTDEEFGQWKEEHQLQAVESTHKAVTVWGNIKMTY